MATENFESNTLSRKDPSRWGFNLHGREHLDVVIASVQFIGYIVEKASSFVWFKCLDYAVKRFLAVKASTIHNAEEWLIHLRAWTAS
ncbi:hypothetical protein E4U13_000153 [Claviceps humidiphila]|uniref:Uncharacterized protein n=1 Tax=Claviceps humidiphila TaxID=1294629 RepID=A0A9P7Q328_9HYPO|nr:hypothetical protein E4U13_000153 [Claviceps humidiphila]